MVKIIIFSVLVLAALAGGSNVLLSNLIQAIVIIEDKSIVRTAINTLRQQSVSVNGNYFLPYGIKEANKQLLPTSFHGARKSAKGNDLLYCPYSELDNVAATDTVQLSALEDYDVTLDSTVSPSGEDYVTRSVRPSVEGVAAFIIIPTRSAFSPLCTDVALNAESEYILTGDSAEKGTVYGVTFNEIAFMHRGGIDEFVRVIDGNEDLQEVLESVSLKPALNAVITLESGSAFSLDDTINFSSTDPLLPRSIIIKSSGVTPATVTGSGAVMLSFLGTSVTFDNVTLGNNLSVLLTDSKSRVLGSSINRLTAQRSQVVMSSADLGSNALPDPAITLMSSSLEQTGNVNLLSGGSSVVAMQGSTWRSEGDLDIRYTGNPVGVQLQESSLSFRNSTITSRGASTALFYVDASSQLTFDSVTWTNSNGGLLQNGIYSLGRLDILNTALSGNGQVSSIIQTKPGAISNIESSTLGSNGSRPTVGWLDDGSASISGDVSVYATTCKDGGRFIENDSAYNITTQDRYVTAISPAPFFGIQATTIDRSVQVDVDSFFVKANIICL